ncbi:hypothetical protein COV11_03625 [Candidatus Woesearchaeota archaeon CG10_big_fil_rev_8_21_14_0_10_30_7]|nr:MAG: hypothetical protein COV11_03625 [Candidatus Woesearchaeota archaeon CG10_big_fil_rev_8_21_14_0_10_30_7]
MEELNKYLTKDGWKKDFKQTKKDLSDLLKDERGSANPVLIINLGFGVLMGYMGVSSLMHKEYLMSIVGFGFAGWNFYNAWTCLKK